MKQNKLVLCWLICLSVVFILAWTNTLKTSTPGATDDPREADDRMREIKGAFVERLDVDHYWTASATSTYDAADTGKHEFITLIDMASDPTAAAGYAHIYMKGDELFYQDDTDTTCQITKDGKVEYQSITDVNSDTYIVSVDNAGTGTANLIKADVNDLAILPDGASLAVRTQTTDGDRTIADKGYVASQKTDVNNIFGTRVTTDSLTAALVKDAVYKAGSDGIVTLYRIHGADSVEAGLTDGSNPPTTVLKARATSSITNKQGGFSMHVRKDDYWKVTCSGITPTIYWLPIGSGTCVKQ